MQGPDDQIMSWIDDHRVSWITSFTKWLMDVGTNYWVLAAVGLGFLGVVVWQRAWRVGVAIVGATAVAGQFSDLLKQHFERPRPAFPDALIQVDGWAMPSSHSSVLAAGSVTVVCVVAWASRRTRIRMSVVLALGTLLVGVAMVYLGAHWPTDLVAGWALGAAIGAVFGYVFRPREHPAPKG